MVPLCSAAPIGSLLLVACLLAPLTLLAQGPAPIPLRASSTNPVSCLWSAWIRSFRATVGIAYGRYADNLPPPAEVVQLLQSQNVQKVRIYDADNAVLSAFHNSGISIIAGVPNNDLQGIAASQDTANQWVQQYIVPHTSVIEYIAVGNEVFYNDQQNAPYLVPAMQNVHTAVTSMGLGSIKVSTAHSTGVLDDGSYPPSNGKFRAWLVEGLIAILEFHEQTGTAFMANVQPFFGYTTANGALDLGLAVFGETEGVEDGNVHYSNLFDIQYDTLVVAMEAVGHGGVEIIVTESGWPSQGDAAATVDNARSYDTGLVSHVAFGTPRRPAAPIPTYLFSLFNENLKDANPPFEQHWGIYNADKTPVFPITL